MLRLAGQGCEEQGEGGVWVCGGVRQSFVFVSAAAVGRYSTLGEEPRLLCGSCSGKFP